MHRVISNLDTQKQTGVKMSDTIMKSDIGGDIAYLRELNPDLGNDGEFYRESEQGSRARALGRGYEL